MSEQMTKAVRFTYIGDSLREETFWVIGNHRIRNAEQHFCNEKGREVFDDFVQEPSKVWLTDEEIEEILVDDEGIDIR